MVARELRLTNPIEFERARSKGTSWTSSLVVAVVLPNELAANRYGFAVGRRVGKAVTRNRVKRLMREAVRELHPRLRQGFDIVFIARNRVNGSTTIQDIATAVEEVLGRAGLLERPVCTDPGVDRSAER